MGDHKTNINSLLRDTIPTFPPLNRECEAGMVLRVMPKRNVFLATPGVEPDAQALAGHAAYCQQAGTEQVVHQMGEVLAPELCDVVLLPVAGWVDTAAPQPTIGRMVLPGEILRLDMKEFIEQAEKSIGGGSRIIKPAIMLATH